MPTFLPTTLKEGKRYYSDFDSFDVIFITGDPYYDHPLSGIAILSRLLDTKGYKVTIIPQPESDEEYQACGRPNYFFCITSGLLDSMLANYTPMLHQRENILVPERALMVYTQNVKKLFQNSITILGGVEATIRRFTHFDYKENKLRRGILNDTKADLLLFGNAERSILTVLERMKKLSEIKSFETIKDQLDLPSIDGAAFRIKKEHLPKTIRNLPSYEDCLQDPLKFNLLTRIHYLLPDDAFIEPCGLGLIQHNRPAHTLQEEEMDLIYELPYTRQLHPQSKNRNFNQLMIEKLEASIIIGRGCWGSCTFCVIPLVQGKEVAKRSKESIIREIEQLYQSGVRKINDLTLPTLNMYGSYCSLYDEAQQIYSPVIEKDITVYNKKKYCNQQCVGCPKRVLSDDLYPLLEEIEKLQQKYPGTSLELRSAIRHDIILNQKKLFRKIMQFTSRLKIAPEHISDTVLKNMNKATKSAFDEFLKEYQLINQEQGTHKNLVPYFIAAHPGTTLKDMEILKKYCREKDIYVNLTQVFTPTPGTAATAMYYTAENPLTREKVYVPRTFREKKDQKNILLGVTSADAELVDENG
ncbi:YgiQ family radical SAM protein [Candidatus Woesearchaeota archaeon]|nr:YgiQ family radical SAM protein [Candidatus Woesearchaeota archaeon]